MLVQARLLEAFRWTVNFSLAGVLFASPGGDWPLPMIRAVEVPLQAT